MLDIDQFFAGRPDARCIFDAVLDAVLSMGDTETRVSKSQVSFRRRRSFAWAWVPGKYLRGKHAPLVLTVSLGRRDSSTRWKEVVEPAPGRFMHHMELRHPSEVDEEVRAFLREAFLLAA